MIAREDATFWRQKQPSTQGLALYIHYFLCFAGRCILIYTGNIVLVWIITPTQHEEGIQASSK
jgi:hypothetical protein